LGWEQVPPGRWSCSGEGAIKGLFSLKHSYDNPESGTDYLVYHQNPVHQGDSLIFTFRVRHGYPPSFANNWQIALLADFSEEDARVQSGIFLGVNYSDSDDLVKIWRCEGENSEVLCTSSINYQEDVGLDDAPQFRLVWSPDGVLKLYFALDPEIDHLLPVGACQLENLPTGRQLVVRYEYSSSRDRSLWLDEIVLDGTFISDTTAPVILSVEVASETSLAIRFSEKILIPALNVFSLEGAIYPDTIYLGDSGAAGVLYMLEYSTLIPNRVELELRVDGICDPDGNCMADTVAMFMRNDAEWGDVVFNELMFDPDPAVRLSEEEYLELYNRSEYKLDLTGWRVEVGNRTHSISELETGSSQSMMESSAYGLLYGIALPNDGEEVALYSDRGTLIHAVDYQVPWSSSDWKREGGWSLESVDPDQVCRISYLWEYSTDPSGGTPGRINSNNAEVADVDAPLLLYMGHEGPGVRSVHYSEPIRFSALDLEAVEITPGKMHPTGVSFPGPMSATLNLHFPEYLESYHRYTLDLPVIADCQGNLSETQAVNLGRLSTLAHGVLLINEIMYHPWDGFPEFVELFNPGPDYFDLWDLALHVVAEGAPPENPVALSDHSRLFVPGDYLVLARCVPQLMDAYNLELSGRWVELKGLTSLTDGGGTIYLTNRSGSVVDVASYGDQMHLEIIGDSRGVSLERISANRPGNDPENWHSAASIDGFATPGRENSQTVDWDAAGDLLEVKPGVFSPDNDGFQDQLEITISTQIQGYVVNLWISDLQGSRVRNLANNHISGPSVTYTWDGETDSGIMAPEGIYVVHVWGYHPVSGDRWRRKAATGIVYR